MITKREYISIEIPSAFCWRPWSCIDFLHVRKCSSADSTWLKSGYNSRWSNNFCGGKGAFSSVQERRRINTVKRLTEWRNAIDKPTEYWQYRFVPYRSNLSAFRSDGAPKRRRKNYTSRCWRRWRPGSEHAWSTAVIAASLDNLISLRSRRIYSPQWYSSDRKMFKAVRRRTMSGW